MRPERPTWIETGGILLACAALLVGLARFDDTAVRGHHASRAAAAAAQQQAETRAVSTAPAGSRTTASRPPVLVAAEEVPGRPMALAWLGLVAVGGLAMAFAGARMLRRRWA